MSLDWMCQEDWRTDGMPAIDCTGWSCLRPLYTQPSDNDGRTGKLRLGTTCCSWTEGRMFGFAEISDERADMGWGSKRLPASGHSL